LELKQIISKSNSPECELSIVPFWNWNFVGHPAKIQSLILSIVPFWNWNNVIYTTSKGRFCYQSYHFGIETSHAGYIIRTVDVYQSYHFGIETSFNIALPFNRNTLSIVPFWNWNEKTKQNRPEKILLYQSYHFGIETWIQR